MKVLIAVLAFCVAAVGQGTHTGGSTNTGGTTNTQAGNAVSVSSLSVTPNVPGQSQVVNQLIGFTATATLSNGQTIPATAIADWSISNTAIATPATLTATENILCVSAGTVQITATYNGASSSAGLTCVAVLPPPPVLVSIALTPALPSVAVGQSVPMTATGTFSDGSTQPITATVNWASGTPANATVGPLTATEAVNCLKGGTSVITATDPTTSISGSTTVTCNAVLLSIVVTPASPSIVAGNAIGFIATGAYNDGSHQDVTTTATWSSATPTVATLGTRTTQQSVNALAAGTSVISAAVGTVTGNTTLTVTNPGPPPPTLSSIVVTPANPTVNVNSLLGFKATGHYSDGSTQDVTSAATWVSLTPANATIQAASNPQNVKCIANGTSVIQATVSPIVGSTTLTCQTPAPTLVSIAVTPPLPTQYNGSSTQFTATGTYSDSSTKDLTTQVTWTSGTPTVATIGASTGLGLCVANSGSSLITATLGVSGTTTITCQPATTNVGENAYVTSTNTWIGPTTDGPVTLPTSGINTAVANTPSPGATVTVVAGSPSDLQLKLTGVVCGTTIKIPANNSYSGQFVYPALACPAGQWVTIETDHTTNLPPEGTRLTPAWVGIASMPGYKPYNQPSSPGNYLPKLISNTVDVPTFRCTPGFSRLRIIGLEITSPAGTRIQNALTSCQSGSYFILDRSYVHGGNSSTGHDADQISEGVNISNTPFSAVINSTVMDIHCIANTCVDSVAVDLGGTGNTTDGPHKLYNDFLSSGSEGIFTGGGGTGASTLPSTDLEIRNDHIFKPLFWKQNDPSYFGTNFIIKNCIEFKNTNRALIEGNVCDQTWVGQSDQFGTHINLGSKNQATVTNQVVSIDGAGNLTWISGALFSPNVVDPQCAIANHCRVAVNGVQLNASPYTAQTYTDNKHISVLPFPTATPSTTATTCAPGATPTAIVANIAERFNQITHGSRGTAIFSVLSDCGDKSLGDQDIYAHDNTQDDINGFKWSTSTGACCAWSSGYQVQNEFDSPNYLQHIWIKHNTSLAFLTGGSQGFGPSLGFGYQSSTGGGITDLQITDNIGPEGFNNGTKGVCTSNALSTLATLQCWDALSGVAQHSFCFDTNALATSTATTGSVTATNKTGPYPGVGQSPGCSFTEKGNFVVPTYDSILFTNLNNGSGGNYLLKTTSQFHNAGSDGKDLGADIATLTQKVAGVASGPSNSANWQLVSTPGGATNISMLAIDSSNNWYIADTVSGIWKSTNQGGSWTQMNSGLGSTRTTTVNINPTNGDIIAGIYNSNYPSAGPVHFYRSTNGGTSWAQIPEPGGFFLSLAPAVTGCLMPNAITNRMLCGGLFGSANTTGFYSTNNGTSTTLINQGTNSSIYSFAYNATSGNFLMGTETQGLFQSTDGVNFSAISPGSGSIRIGNILGITTNSAEIPLVSSQGGVWLCNTSTTCLTPTNVLTNPNTSAGQGLYTDSFGSIYEGHNHDTGNPITIYRSTDQGATWQEWDFGIPSPGLVGHQFIENNFDGKIYAVIQSGSPNPGQIYSTPK